MAEGTKEAGFALRDNEETNQEVEETLREGGEDAKRDRGSRTRQRALKEETEYIRN